MTDLCGERKRPWDSNEFHRLISSLLWTRFAVIPLVDMHVDSQSVVCNLTQHLHGQAVWSARLIDTGVCPEGRQWIFNGVPLRFPLIFVLFGVQLVLVLGMAGEIVELWEADLAWKINSDTITWQTVHIILQRGHNHQHARHIGELTPGKNA